MVKLSNLWENWAVIRENCGILGKSKMDKAVYPGTGIRNVSPGETVNVILDLFVKYPQYRKLFEGYTEAEGNAIAKSLAVPENKARIGAKMEEQWADQMFNGLDTPFKPEEDGIGYDAERDGIETPKPKQRKPTKAEIEVMKKAAMSKARRENRPIQPSPKRDREWDETDSVRDLNWAVSADRFDKNENMPETRKLLKLYGFDGFNEDRVQKSVDALTPSEVREAVKTKVADLKQKAALNRQRRIFNEKLDSIDINVKLTTGNYLRKEDMDRFAYPIMLDIAEKNGFDNVIEMLRDTEEIDITASPDKIEKFTVYYSGSAMLNMPDEDNEGEYSPMEYTFKNISTGFAVNAGYQQ